MTDILIKDLPAEVVAAIDDRAERLGLSRDEYAKQVLTDESHRPLQRVTVEDLRRLADLIQDARNPEIMRKAWE